MKATDKTERTSGVLKLGNSEYGRPTRITTRKGGVS